MKRLAINTLIVLLTANLIGCNSGRQMRTAIDITPGNPVETELDWRYGANDLRIQTTNINKQLMDRWFAKTNYDIASQGKPKIIITEVVNRTDTLIPTDMIREIFESAAINDGRYTIVVADTQDERELDNLLGKINNHSKYANSSKPKQGNATAPQFLAKISLTKATTKQPKYDLEDYRMTVRLYDVETQEAIDAAYDVLHKKVKA